MTHEELIEATGIAVGKEMVGPIFDPFADPEAFTFACEIARAAIRVIAPAVGRALRERDQAVEALRKVRAEGMSNHNTRCKPWWNDVRTTLASIEGTGHE